MVNIGGNIIYLSKRTILLDCNYEECTTSVTFLKTERKIPINYRGNNYYSFDASNWKTTDRITSLILITCQKTKEKNRVMNIFCTVEDSVFVTLITYINFRKLTYRIKSNLKKKNKNRFSFYIGSCKLQSISTFIV